jgi:hypothetical protein
LPNKIGDVNYLQKSANLIRRYGRLDRDWETGFQKGVRTAGRKGIWKDFPAKEGYWQYA